MPSTAAAPRAASRRLLAPFPHPKSSTLAPRTQRAVIASRLRHARCVLGLAKTCERRTWTLRFSTRMSTSSWKRFSLALRAAVFPPASRLKTMPPFAGSCARAVLDSSCRRQRCRCAARGQPRGATSGARRGRGRPWPRAGGPLSETEKGRELRRVGWEAGIRTPIKRSRAACPTVRRPPNRPVAGRHVLAVPPAQVKRGGQSGHPGRPGRAPGGGTTIAPPDDGRCAPGPHRRGRGPGRPQPPSRSNASCSSVFCSSAWAFAEPVAGLALSERLTVRTRRPPEIRSRRGTT